MTTPIEKITNRQIGVVESISPSEIKVNLDVEAPHSIAMGTGNPQLFPRLNGFLLIPCESGFIVGRIGWLSIEPSPYPKRKGVRDFGILDLPFPSRKLKLNMLGILKSAESEKDQKYKFTRGVHSFPALGDSVLLPDRKQLRSIIESGTSGKVKIGSCPLADDADVKIDPDRLFGRHLAVLGNTGSGKSCTVSGLIRWSLKEAQEQLQKTKNPKESDAKKKNNLKPNARFIILDPNGEYSNTFQNFKPRIFKVYPQGEEKPLQTPSWFWNSHEWASITQATGKTQIPLLRQALRAMRTGAGKKFNIKEEIKNFLKNLLTSIREDKRKGGYCGNFPGPKNLSEKMEKWKESLKSYSDKNLEDDLQNSLNSLIDLFQKMCSEHIKSYALSKYNYLPYSTVEINEIINKLEVAFQAFGGSEKDYLQIGEDAPIRFDENNFINHIEYLIQQSKESYFDFFLMRIKTIFSDNRMKKIISDSGSPITLKGWMDDYIGNDSEDSLINIIDLSLVPKDIIYLVAAVISRMIFEALQRYKSEEQDRRPLPTVLMMEEAHTFIQKYKKDSEDFSASRLCAEVFERIAKEGRKFGLGLVLSSQRPSELSPTVLSQCNTFLLHRITNDRDQEMVSRLLPDSLKGTMQELPALPSRHAYLLGWASEIPILTEISYLPKEARPQSDDPDFWDVWTRKAEKERKVDWTVIADKWQNKPTS